MKFILSLLIIIKTYSAQRADAFLINILDTKVKVVSPPKHSKNLHAIITNESLTTITGKVLIDNSKVLGYVTIPPGEPESVHIGLYPKSKITFVPLAPSFQEIELIVGKRPYEIPPKKEI